MTRRVSWTNGLMALFAVAAGLVIAGCCGGIDLNLGSGCDAPSPCEPPAASPCDPCAGGMAARPQGLPPEAKAGEAWCRVMVPAKYEETEEKVCCKPASTNRKWIEPVYEERERKVCCTPARCKTVSIPAEYAEKSEQVMTCPARTVWKKIPCEPDHLKAGEKQGDCWKLVETPAQYKTVTHRVCTKPASCKKETIPPVYKTVKEKVMVKPGSWKCTPVEAQYKMVKRRRMVSPCHWEWRRNEACDVPEGTAPAGKSQAGKAAESKADGSAAPDASESKKSPEDDLGEAPTGK
jgi:hypothetical protein